MSDQTLLRERLQMILTALERFPRRFAKIKTQMISQPVNQVLI